LFYDSMISKLIVWGDTRADAIARLSRVLEEYRVIGVRTTLPFFRWLAAQPEFASGDFDTTYLDTLLAARTGQAFVDPTDEDVDDAVVAAALASWFHAHQASAGAPPAAAGGVWRRAARTEALR
jgi:acetyl/propionyl-CoA carboxylase alpha subunit